MRAAEIELRGLAQNNVREAIQLVVSAVGPQIQRAVDADGEDDRWAAVNALLAGVLVEGIRYTWSEFVAQLMEAGAKVTGSLDIDSVPPSGEV